MYINAVAKGVMLLLYSWHDSLNIIFKIKHKLHITSGSSPSPPWKIWSAHVVTFHELLYSTHSSVLRPFRKTAHTCSSSWLILIAFCEVRPVFKCDVVWFFADNSICWPFSFVILWSRWLPGTACCSLLNIDECLAFSWIIYHNCHDTWTPLCSDAWRLHSMLHTVINGVSKNVACEMLRYRVRKFRGELGK
jgi:hypothetical protein